VKQFWVDLRQWDKDLATGAIESGADALVVEDAESVRVLGRIMTVAPDGDLVPGKDVFEVVISGKEDEEKAVSYGSNAYVVVTTSDWTVIPLENLVSQSDRIIAAVNDSAEAELALNVLECGVAGVLLKTSDPQEIRRVADIIKGSTGEVDLVPLTVTAVLTGAMGDRVCVDMCSILKDGEGLLVGNTSSSFMLVHAETLENPYVSPRPFRVNAGAVHAYVMMADGRTSYLSELKAGDRVLVTDSNGGTKEAMVGRVKIERRPLLVVETRADDGFKSGLVLQNAETVRLVGETGAGVSVVDLSPGDRVLGYVTKAGRHFGVAVEETIIEK